MSTEISTAKQAADHELVLGFGRLQGAANRLEYILGRALEEHCGISHLMFEVLLILGRAGGAGLPMNRVAQEQVLTTGGRHAPRLRLRRLLRLVPRLRLHAA